MQRLKNLKHISQLAFCMVILMCITSNANAQSGTLSFKGDYSHQKLGPVLRDGQFSSVDIPGIDICIFGASTSQNATDRISEGNLYYTNYNSVDNKTIYSDDGNPQYLVLYSSSNNEFSFESFSFIDVEYPEISPITIEGFKDGSSTGKVSTEFEWDMMTLEVTTKELIPSIFGNVDEVRFFVTDELNPGSLGILKINYEFNNFTIAPPHVVATVTTQEVSGIGTTIATGNGNITDLGNPNPTAYGFCWNTTGTPTTSDNKVDKGAVSANGAFTASITSLSANTTYYVRAFVTNPAGTTYGSEVTFATLPLAPTSISATAGDGQATVSFTPPVSDGGDYTVTSSPGGITATGVQSPITVTGLTNGTEYNFTVTATNSAGTSAASEPSNSVIPFDKSNVLVVSNDYSDETQAAAQLVTDLSATYDVTVTTIGLPASLDGYSQIYDIRISTALTADEQTSYTSFLNTKPGNSLYLSGEVPYFNARNESVSSFIALTGGGTIASPNDELYSTQSLKVPLNTGAVDLSSIYIAGFGVITSPGTGSFIGTNADGNTGCGVYFPQGSLVNAPQGCLVVVYDITFISDPSSGVNSDAFRANLEQVMAAGGTLAGPVASTTSLSANLNPASTAWPVRLTASVAPGATGEVKFMDGTSLLGTYSLKDGSAIFNCPFTKHGTHTITAQYLGDASHNPSVSEPLMLAIYTVPDAPTIVSATAGDGQATVSFTPPVSDGGSTITGYRVTSHPGIITATGSQSPITVKGLTNGTEYSFTVSAHNNAGGGSQSDPSNAITPFHTTVITWSNPADITYGAALGNAQLNATTDVSGTFIYTPAVGTLLNAGDEQTLSVDFTPANQAANTTASKSITINVAKAPLTVTATSQTIRKGEAIPVLAISYNGFVNNEDENVLDTRPNASTTATATSDEGTYVIDVSGGSDNNYDFNYVTGELVITTPTGIDDLNAESIAVYPNPFSGQLTVSIDGESNGIYTLTTLSGATVQKGIIEGGKADLQLQHLQPGVYMLGIEINGKLRTVKVFKK